MKIQLDIDDIINELNLPKNTADLIVSNCVDAVTQEIYRNWRLEASNALTSTRNDYLNGLEIVNNSIYSRTIKLNGVFNNMVEKGSSPYDMKEGFRRSSKVKYSTKVDKNGNVSTNWYLTIPFRIGVPTTIGDNSAFSGIMPKSVHKVAKSQPAGKGLKKSQIPSPYDIPTSRQAISIPSRNIDIPEYKHKHSIYEGMTKSTAAYGKTTQNSYVSFRRVSEKSSANSWIHSGIKAHNLMKKAVSGSEIDTLVENTVDETLANLGYGE